MIANHGMQPMGASRSAHRPFGRLWRLCTKTCTKTVMAGYAG